MTRAVSLPNSPRISPICELPLEATRREAGPPVSLGAGEADYQAVPREYGGTLWGRQGRA